MTGRSGQRKLEYHADESGNIFSKNLKFRCPARGKTAESKTVQRAHCCIQFLLLYLFVTSGYVLLLLPNLLRCAGCVPRNFKAETFLKDIHTHIYIYILIP